LDTCLARQQVSVSDAESPYSLSAIAFSPSAHALFLFAKRQRKPCLSQILNGKSLQLLSEARIVPKKTAGKKKKPVKK
jgi:hypothetical protein